MKRSIIRWTLFGGSVLIAGPMIRELMDLIPSLDGGSGMTPLISSAPIIGVGLVLLSVGLAFVLAVIAARFVGFREGWACLGLALAWGCWATARVTDVARVTGATPGPRLAAEGAILGIFMAAAAWLVLRFSRNRHDHIAGEASPVSFASLIGLAACVVGALLGGWLFARTPTVGQAFGAAVAGGVLGGLLARVMQPTCSAEILPISLPITASVGFLAGHWLTGHGNQVEQLYAGTASALLHIMPLDWMAGLMIGLPVGISWGGALVERHSSQEAVPGGSSTQRA